MLMKPVKQNIDLGIVVSDATECLHFYRDILGLEKTEIIPDVFTGSFAAKWPGRSVPECGAVPVGLDFVFRHPGIVIPRTVVCAHMIEAEPDIFTNIVT